MPIYNFSTDSHTWWRTFWWWLNMTVLDWRWRPFEQSTPCCYIYVHLICSWEVLSLLLEYFSLSLELRFPWYHWIQKLNLKTFTKIFCHDTQCSKLEVLKMLTVTENCGIHSYTLWYERKHMTKTILNYTSCPVQTICALHWWHIKNIKHCHIYTHYTEHMTRFRSYTWYRFSQWWIITWFSLSPEFTFCYSLDRWCMNLVAIQRILECSELTQTQLPTS